MQDRQEGPVPAELQALDGGAVLVTMLVATEEARDWLMVRTAAMDWAGKVSKSDWASFRRPLADWQIRVLGEAYELKERMGNLSEFVRLPARPGVSKEAWALMNRQWWAMDTLHQVLRERIAGFGAQS
jgi:hypothetical protein